MDFVSHANLPLDVIMALQNPCYFYTSGNIDLLPYHYPLSCHLNVGLANARPFNLFNTNQRKTCFVYAIRGFTWCEWTNQIEIKFSEAPLVKRQCGDMISLYLTYENEYTCICIMVKRKLQSIKCILQK